MDWQDDEFETFLRQFRPSKPKALPTHWPKIVVWGTAALVLGAAITAAQYVANGRTAITPKPNAAVNRGADSESTARAPKTTAIVPTLPAASPFKGAGQSSLPPLNGKVSNMKGAANRRFRVGVDAEVNPPRKLVDVPPIYPDDAKAAGIQGVVILDIVIGEDGSVIETSVLRSIPELDQAAIDAVSQWKYEITLLNGEPIEVELNVMINFTLSK